MEAVDCIHFVPVKFSIWMLILYDLTGNGVAQLDIVIKWVLCNIIAVTTNLVQKQIYENICSYY